jgi:peptidoglycan-associated lipoprotein
MRERLAKEFQDAYFDFEKSTLRPDAREALMRDGEALKAILHDFPTTNAIVEGHCDERGSAEYNRPSAIAAPR